MAINISVPYNGGVLPDIILLTQGYYLGEPVLIPCSGFVFTSYQVCNSISTYYYHACLMMYYYIVFVFDVFLVSMHGD